MQWCDRQYSASRVLFCVGNYAVRLMPKISGISSLSLSLLCSPLPPPGGGREHSSAIQASIYLPFGFLPLPPTSRKKERVIAVVSARLRGRAEDRGGTVGHCSSALPDIYCLPVSVATTHVCPPPLQLRYGRGRGLVCVYFSPFWMLYSKRRWGLRYGCLFLPFDRESHPPSD